MGRVYVVVVAYEWTSYTTLGLGFRFHITSYM